MTRHLLNEVDINVRIDDAFKLYYGIKEIKFSTLILGHSTELDVVVIQWLHKERSFNDVLSGDELKIWYDRIAEWNRNSKLDDLLL